MAKVPELKNIFSYVLNGDDLVVGDDGILIKDISTLLYSRKSDEIIIIDSDASRVDENLLSSIIIE